MGVSPEQAPDKPTYITLSFEKGVPVALDGQKMSAKEIILKLNELGGANGIGLVDLVENRLVGMKSRGVYETPAARSCTRHTTRWKPSASTATRSIISSRLPSSLQSWCTMASGTPLRQALTAFVDTTQENVTGEVKLKLYKGQYHQRRHDQPLLAVFRRNRNLWRRQCLRPNRFPRLYQSVWPAHQGQRPCWMKSASTDFPRQHPAAALRCCLPHSNDSKGAFRE